MNFDSSDEEDAGTEESNPEHQTQPAEEDDEWVIETISQRKRQQGEVHYRVVWKSFRPTWETEEWLYNNGYDDWLDAFESGALKNKQSDKKHEQTIVISNKESGVQLGSRIQLNAYFCPEVVWPEFGSRITAVANAAHKQVLVIRSIVSTPAARKFANVARKADMEQYVLAMLYAQLPAYFSGTMKEKLTWAIKNLKVALPHDPSVRDVFVFAAIMDRKTFGLVTVLPCFVASVADMKHEVQQRWVPTYVGSPAAQVKAVAPSCKSGARPSVPLPGCDTTKGQYLHKGVLKEAMATRHSDKDVRALPQWLKKFHQEGLLKGRRIDRSREAVKHRASQPRSVAVH